MPVSDLASLLIYIVSGGASVVASKMLEQFDWFQSLTPNGKLISVVGVSALLALVAVFLQGVIAKNPFISESVDPYVKALLPLVNLFVTQITHGVTKTQTLRAEAQALGRTIRGDE